MAHAVTKVTDQSFWSVRPCADSFCDEAFVPMGKANFIPTTVWLQAADSLFVVLTRTEFVAEKFETVLFEFLHLLVSW